MIKITKCQACGSSHLHEVLDLGRQPLANSLPASRDAARTERLHPLGLLVCYECWLMQLSHMSPPADLFSEYLYFSSYSKEMLDHAASAAGRYVAQKSLGPGSFVLEIASNDGYMLRNFVAAGIPCLGVEPAANVAAEAVKAGVPTLAEFFSEDAARRISQRHGKADLVLANNVFAHVPDLHDFLRGMAAVLSDEGWAVFEFPYGVEMIEKTEFDTIYHEHCYYFTLTSLLPLMKSHGLEIFGVESLRIHGGSLRLFVGHAGRNPVRPEVRQMALDEASKKVGSLDYYARFSSAASAVRDGLRAFISEQLAAGRTIAAYGASAKGSTLLNYVGEAARAVAFIADRSPHKQGRFSPGLHLPIVAAGELVGRMPDYALLLTWNFADEIIEQQAEYLTRGGAFVIPVPELRIIRR